VKRTASIGALSAAAALCTAGPAYAHDITGAQLSCTGLTFNASAYGAGPRVLQVKIDTAAGAGAWTSVPFTGVADPKVLIPVSHSLSGFAPAPRNAYVIWNTGGHVGGSEVKPVATFADDCPAPVPPIIPPVPPRLTPPPPVADDQCVSRRVIRVRVAREWKNKLRSGQLYYPGRDKGEGKLRLRKHGKQRGKLTGRLDFRGLKVSRELGVVVGFKVVTNQGTEVRGARRYRLCKPRAGALNLPIGTRVPFAES
jgi:hypothetical protein